MDDTLTPEASTLAEIQPFLRDTRWLDAPRQLRDAFIALTNGAPFVGCLQVKELPDAKLKWLVVAVAAGSIIHIEGIGPNKPERFVAGNPLTVDVQIASVYPRSALGSVSCLTAESLPQTRPDDPPVIIPNYIAHLPSASVPVDPKTAAALIGLLRDKSDCADSGLANGA
jgi:hypothetical protein